MNIADIEMQLADLVKQPFDQGEFAFSFLEIYRAPKATLAKLRSGTQSRLPARHVCTIISGERSKPRPDRRWRQEVAVDRSGGIIPSPID